MSREFLEETGVSTKPEEWQLNVIMKGADFDVYVFGSVGDISEAHTMEAEEVYIGLVADLPTKAIKNLTWLIPFILDPTPLKPITVLY
jgi:hypothetical protein